MKTLSSHLKSIPENAFGFHTKLILFIERIEVLRKKMQKETRAMRVLDVGCGTGMQMTFPLGSQGYAVTGIDPHAPSIEFAKQKNLFPNVAFIGGNIEEISEEKYDSIILSDILEHLEDPEKFLKTLRNLLAEEGILLISIPNGYGPFEVENFILRKTGMLRLGHFLRDRWQKPKEDFVQSLNHDSGHVQFFARKAFEKLMASAGFQIMHFETGSFLCGSVTSRIINRFSPLVRFNILAGKYLPYYFSSVWYFEAKQL